MHPSADDADIWSRSFEAERHPKTDSNLDSLKIPCAVAAAIAEWDQSRFVTLDKRFEDGQLNE